jgi:hypothetical protein
LRKDRQTSPSIPDLIDILKLAIDTYKSVFIVVDALDEASDKGTRKDFVENLYALSPKVRFMVTSRKQLPRIEDLFHMPDTTWLPISPHHDDIETYVEQELKGRRHPTLCEIIDSAPDLHRHVVNSVIKAAGEMFVSECCFHLLMIIDNPIKVSPGSHASRPIG